ncbi:MAG: hypothetical protein EOO77_06565 [Oxalobacteraceae bacterium]|nr:MAG: hypothetical protein EOO77_06565 [Oxalobacteraceae bacterium]
MADTILTPIPYNSGTIVNNSQTFDFCHLGNGKFLHVVGQTTPGFIYAYVSNNVNLKTGTFSTSVPSMRAILSGTNVPTTIASLRLTKIASNRAALAVNGKVFIVEVDVNDDMSVKTGTYQTIATLGQTNTVTTVSTPSSATYGATSTTAGQPVGTLFQMFSPRDNIIYMFERTYTNSTGSFAVGIRKLVYNPADQSLTNIGQFASYTPAASSNYGPYSFTRFYCQDIPGSTSKLLSIRAQVTTSSNTAQFISSSIVAAWVVDTADNTQSLNGSFPAGIQVLCPMSTTTILGIASSKSYFTYTAGAWNSAAAVFSANGSPATSSPVVQAEALDANYFILWTVSNTELNANQTYYTRVGRFVDSAFGQVSTGTASGDGVGFSMFPLHPESSCIVRDGTDAFYALSRAGVGTFTPSVKVIYQAGG